MTRNGALTFRDPLYGLVTFPPALGALIWRPIVQRLRHIRLSNIDSVNLPGFANISRFEHALGACYLGTCIGFAARLPEEERLLIPAAALVHDAGITPFGHLIEEALQYVGAGFDHERKWLSLFELNDQPDVGGIQLQIYAGHEGGLKEWVGQYFATREAATLRRLLEYVEGKGTYGACIAGPLDLDNLDNVVRAAHHLGLGVDRTLPRTIAKQLIGVEAGELVFEETVVEAIRAWLSARREVYQELMLAPADFVGKSMILYAVVKAVEGGSFGSVDWHITDTELVSRLVSMPPPVGETVRRWLVGRLWSLAGLTWFEGPTPTFKETYAFARHVSEILGRECFAYRIKDKRTRLVKVHLRSGAEVMLGEESRNWLLGVTGPARREFTARERAQILDAAVGWFGRNVAAMAEGPRPLFGST